jgi:Flp pilus assembly protein protease CpaA
MGTPLIIKDVRERRIPNKIVLPMLALSLVSTIVATAISGAWLIGLLSVLVAVLFFGAGLALNLRGALGMGDVKLITAILLPLGLLSFWLPLIIIGVSLVTTTLTIVAILSVRNLRHAIGGTLPMAIIIVPVSVVATAFVALG